MLNLKFKPKYISRIFLALILMFIIYFGTIILTARATYYNPEKTEKISTFENPDTIDTNLVFTCLTWNIGYAGLGEDMDFFYDGGKKVRDGKANTAENLKNINNFLYKLRDSVDFILLQEVDVSSRRSYYTNETELLCNNFNNRVKSFALNYNVSFVPVPIFTPLGKVKSGLLTHSVKTPKNATRYGFNKNFGFPKKLFMLNRCYMVNRFFLNNGKELILINVHNSAFDDGDLRLDQLSTIIDFAKNEFQNGNYVLAGGDWNQSPVEVTNDFKGYKRDHRSMTIPANLLPEGWHWHFDDNTPTNRDLSTRLSDETLTQVIDYYMVSPNLEALEVKCIDLKFKYADHNPVYLTFRFN